MPPTDWGWSLQEDGQLDLVASNTLPSLRQAPRMISCRCKSHCGKTCGFRKMALPSAHSAVDNHVPTRTHWMNLQKPRQGRIDGKVLLL